MGLIGLHDSLIDQGSGSHMSPWGREARKHTPLWGGELQSWERLRVEGVGPPMAPPNLDLVGFTSKFTSVVTNITSKFANVLG